MDVSHILKKVTGGCFRVTRPVVQPTGRWQDAVWREAVDLLQTRNWRTAATKEEV
jgi:predicted molibdopterin-dependent oxidoreductase YjgC